MSTENNKEFYAAIETIANGLGVARNELIYVDGRVNNVDLRAGLKAAKYRIQLVGISDEVYVAVREVIGWKQFQDGKYLGDTSVVSMVKQLPLQEGAIPPGSSLTKVTLTPETGEPVVFFAVMGIPRNWGMTPKVEKPVVEKPSPKKPVTRPPIREPERGGTMVIKDMGVLDIGRENVKPSRRPRHGKSGTERRLGKESKWQ